MRDKQIIDDMTALAGRFGQKIEFDEFDGRGGWCRVKGTDRVIINKRLSPKEQVRILAQILARFPVEEHAMAPRVRQLIEDARQELIPEPEPPVNNEQGTMNNDGPPENRES